MARHSRNSSKGARGALAARLSDHEPSGRDINYTSLNYEWMGQENICGLGLTL